jgi:hypothetical protein
VIPQTSTLNGVAATIECAVVAHMNQLMIVPQLIHFGNSVKTTFHNRDIFKIGNLASHMAKPLGDVAQAIASSCRYWLKASMLDEAASRVPLRAPCVLDA